MPLDERVKKYGSQGQGQFANWFAPHSVFVVGRREGAVGSHCHTFSDAYAVARIEYAPGIDNAISAYQYVATAASGLEFHERINGDIVANDYRSSSDRVLNVNEPRNSGGGRYCDHEIARSRTA